MKKIVIIGYDPEIIEMVLKTRDVLGYVDNYAVNDNFKLMYMGNDNEFTKNVTYKNDIELLITIDNPLIRGKLFNFYSNKSFNFSKCIAQNANISKFSRISSGAVVQELVNISYNVDISSNVKVNTAANIMHDVNIGNNSTIAPNAVLLGYVNVMENCFIGANSTILPQVKVLPNTIVGAGAVVTKTDGPGTYIGVPARKKKCQK